MVRRIVLSLLLITSLACTTTRPTIPAAEFRGVWLTTVGNSDWPSRPGLTTEEQQQELRSILDCIAATNLNAVMLHARPHGDAFYASSIEPWSDYITGELGKPPHPYYDPLQFAIDEAHKRGLELHAWLNPYRARPPIAVPAAYPGNISSMHPGFVHPYGRMWWLDPGEPEVRAYVVSVVRDIVQRYDVDGIHFDDYFYPYPEGDAPFPDEASWNRYQASGGTLSRDDWRRQNVDLLIEETGRAVHFDKPNVRFGVSPFGIWRPKHPRSVRGFDAYAKIYADSRKWLQNGWVDYLTPQLYWARSAPQQRFDHLLRWWQRQNRRGVGLWPGLAAYRTSSGRPNQFAPDEVVQQIEQIRRRRGDGWILFTAKTLMHDRGGITDRLRQINPQPVPTPRGRVTPGAVEREESAAKAR